jgi:hypothetical protein
MFGTQLLTKVELLEGADNDGLPNGLGVFGTERVRMLMLKSDKLGMLMLGIEGGGREIEGMERVGRGGITADGIEIGGIDRLRRGGVDIDGMEIEGGDRAGMDGMDIGGAENDGNESGGTKLAMGGVNIGSVGRRGTNAGQ